MAVVPAVAQVMAAAGPGRPALVGAAVASGLTAPASAPQPDLQEQVDLILARTQARAELMIRQAEERAGLMIDQAVEGAQSIAEEARRAAAEEGYREGLEQGRQEAEKLRQEAAALQAEALAASDRLFDQSREEVVRLALTVAQQFVRQELDQDPGLLLPLVDEALARVRGAEEASLRVNPEAVRALEPSRGELAARHGLAELKLVGDAGLAPGDLQVHTFAGSVDVRMDRQIESLQSSLSEVVRRG